jgi:predicted dehydrogenase
VATQYQAAYATTSFEEVLADTQVQLVIIATRHSQHAGMALAALRAGKHVFVEKPLALTPAELDAIEELYTRRGADAPLLMTGFNRRFSPAVGVVRQVVRERSAPLLINYRMNAGYLPSTHWVHGSEGGGRNIGEACHIYDLFQAITGSTWVDYRALSISARAGQFRPDDNFVVIARYADGSLCTLTYTALGAKEYPKERMEVFCDGMVLFLDDYKSLTIAGGAAAQWSAKTAQKGQFEELQALGKALRGGGEWPIPLADQLAVTRLSFAVDRALAAGEA